jgi:protocatechuate 3,4-dioxygenase, alpha subunit
MSGITPSQTVGPYFAIALTPGDYDWAPTVGNNLVTPDASGERIAIEGRVLDGDAKPVDDAMVEIWQADGAGRYAHPGDARANPNAAFKGFGRAGTDESGRYRFDTVKPGVVPGPNGSQAPHVLLAVFARGMLRHFFTRLYFSDEAGNDADPILRLVPPERRATLIARREDGGTHAVYRFDIRLQGENETVFFDL